MPLIAIEGADGTGKSTLAEAIAKRCISLGYTTHLLHNGPPTFDPESPLTRSQQVMAQMMAQVTRRGMSFVHDAIVIDRWFWGECVYAPIFRPNPDQDQIYGGLDHAEFDALTRFVSQRGIIVYCENEPEVILQRLANRGDWMLSSDENMRRQQINSILFRYNAVIKASPESVYYKVHLLEGAQTEYEAEQIIDFAIEKSQEFYTLPIKEVAARRNSPVK